MMMLDHKGGRGGGGVKNLEKRDLVISECSYVIRKLLSI